MKKEVLRKVMKRAHEIARKMVGDYIARLKMALKIAWAEIKTKGVKVMEGFKRIQLGAVEFKHGLEVYKGEINIIKETDKAFFVEFEGVMECYDILDETLEDVIEGKKVHYWLPKSQVKVEGNTIYVPEWLVKKNYIIFAQ